MATFSYCTAQFLTVYKHAQEVPTAKYEYPQTEAQEYGWVTKPLVRMYVCNGVHIIGFCVQYMQ